MILEIPNKSLFKLDEVCSLTGIRPYILRFWENEFSEISPQVSSSGKKMYEQRDIEIILFVKKLLFEEKMSIEKARAILKTINWDGDGLYEQESDASWQLEASTDSRSDVDKNETLQECDTTGNSKGLVSRSLSSKDLKRLEDARGILQKCLSELEGIKGLHQW